MVICLSGENSYSLRTALDTFIADFVRDHGDMAVERVDGETASLERINESLQSLPFFSTRKLVVLHTPGANKRFTEAVADILQGVPEVIDVLVVEPKLDKRGSYYKWLKKATEFHEYTEMDEQGLTVWLSAEAKRRGGSLTLADARFLVGRIGLDQRLLTNELDKLLLYNPAVTRQSITLLSEPTPQSSIFELLDAAFAGDLEKALLLYKDQREQKVDTSQIIAMLTWQLRILALIKTAGRRPAQDIARESKLNPYAIRKSQAIADRITYAELKSNIARLLAIDVRSKRTELDVDEALQNYLISLSA